MAPEALLGWRQARSRSQHPRLCLHYSWQGLGAEGVWAEAPDHRLALRHAADCPCRVLGPGRVLNCQTGLGRVPWALLGVALVFHCLNIDWVWSGGQPWRDPSMQCGNTPSLSSLSCRASSKIHGCKGERESNFSWGNIHDLDMPQPWFCSSPVVLIHVGSDPSWDQTGQRLLRDFWLENRSRAQNRRKRMKGFRIRLRMITFVLAVAIPHAHAALGSCFLAAPHKVLMEQHPGCAWSTHSAHKSQPGSGASPRVCYWPHRAVYHVFYLILLWADWEPDDKNVPCMI